MSDSLLLSFPLSLAFPKHRSFKMNIPPLAFESLLRHQWADDAAEDFMISIMDSGGMMAR